MNRQEFEAAVNEALNSELKRMEGVPFETVAEYTEWNRLAESGIFTHSDGTRRQLCCRYCSVTGERWVRVLQSSAERRSARRRPALPEMDLMTTPEESFSGGSQTGEPA